VTCLITHDIVEHIQMRLTQGQSLLGVGIMHENDNFGHEGGSLYESLSLRSPSFTTTLPGFYKRDAKRRRSEARVSRTYASDYLNTVAS
jgi:hypothetical protein